MMTNTPNNILADNVKAYCAQIGADPLLVQGAGGNVSWKDQDILWVKASGKWLANANQEDIFIPVDLANLKVEIAQENFSAKPKIVTDSVLRPSIETMLHALMPHTIVIHLHAVEILAYLVRENPLENLKRLIDDSIKWIFVDYFKPGEDLAHAVSDQLAKNFKADVVFLKNHGLVIGGENLESIEHTLKKLLEWFKTEPLLFSSTLEKIQFSNFPIEGYFLSRDQDVNTLATSPELASRLKSDWALYPDHLVFLGEKAFVINQSCELSFLENTSARPNFIFVVGEGVYENMLATEAHRVQLRCYYDVLIRQKISENLVSLSSIQVAELLDWDAERYRQNFQLNQVTVL